MIREMVKIDEALCDGCGLCVPGCHEGALQVIDGKARLISDLMCDGLGACLGHCPQGAITIEKREAEAYNETKVMEIMVEKGMNTVVAHLNHLKEHNETVYLREGVKYLLDHESGIPFPVQDVINEIHEGTPKVRARIQLGQKPDVHQGHGPHQGGGGCPGSQAVRFEPKTTGGEMNAGEQQSQLSHWPVQMHLINPVSASYRNADVVIAADCVAFAMGNFHSRFLKGKSLAIACPKLDSNTGIYIEKITRMIDEALVNTLTVMIMEVPCCGGLLQMVMNASQAASRKVPVKAIKVSLKGEILSETWM
ncbi:MAG: 4Fe-4S ferredoxin [Bacteroidetes bacterium]|nr:4Fe-4S ferredoxin [Bacteroidota bacterium]